MSTFPTGTVTFLFSDIQGSTQLLKDLGRDEYGRVLSLHNELLRSAFEENGGIEIDRQGDSFFAVFGSAGSAVAAAIAGQRALLKQEWPSGGVVRVRMGVHTGEATVGADGYVGFAVHQASRIGDAGHGGQILLSSTTAGLVEHDLPSDACATSARTGSTGSTGRNASTSSSSPTCPMRSRRSRRARRPRWSGVRPRSSSARRSSRHSAR